MRFEYQNPDEIKGPSMKLCEVIVERSAKAVSGDCRFPFTARAVVIVVIALVFWGVAIGAAIAVLRNIPGCWL